MGNVPFESGETPPPTLHELNSIPSWLRVWHPEMVAEGIEQTKTLFVQ